MLASVAALRHYAGLSCAEGIPTPGELGVWLSENTGLDPAITKSKILTLLAHLGPELEKRSDAAWWKRHAEHVRKATKETVHLLIEEGRSHFLAQAERLLADLPGEQAQWEKAVGEWREMLGGQLSPGSIEQWNSDATDLWLARGLH